ncbi:BnaC03g73740D [Brassica napus]|uniref:BnaC03g73740D protein n=1 Tax=Brassica napus TaxID=3708 RepID=A0A078IPM4_BRANA|nr:BnaC03g73740D [Brassica napus]
MATVCVRNVGTSPEKKLSTASYSCRGSKMSVMSQKSQPSDPKLENEDPVDFEFLLEDPVTMLSADELFSDGKLIPLKFSGSVSSREKPITTAVNTAAKPCRRLEMESADPYTFSPRAPRCTMRWRELLGLKRLTKTPEEASSPPSRLSSSTPNPKTASFRYLLNRSSKSSKDSDISETSTSVSSSRLSLSSSSSSGHDLDDVPRLSLDRDNKPNNAPNPFARSRAPHHHHQLRKPRRHSPSDKTTERALTVTADSPRLNASGKIVFHGLERSSSSPASANVRITPVLNVPLSSLRGGSKPGLSFGQLFASSSGNNITKNRTKTSLTGF